MNTKITISLIALAVIAGAFFIINPATSGYVALESYAGNVEYYRSGSCGCCGVHSDYLSTKGGLNVNNKDVSDVEAIKNKYGVPSDLWSCHTAIIGGYFVEGHMPLEAIDKLLTEKPDIAGIALPGMPAGSPGMTGAKQGDFVIYSVNKDKTYQEFMRI